MKFDEIVQSLGEFGAYQKKVYFLLCLASMSCGVQVMISVFTLGVPNHRCALPGMPNDTYHPVSDEHVAMVNASIPWDESVGEDGGYSECLIRIPSNETDGEASFQECNSWVYDNTLFSSSVVNKFDLVCEKKMARSHGRMILMAGLLLGAIGAGIIADIIGRKLALMSMVTLHATTSIGVAWTQSFVVYVIVRFLTGISISGLFLAIFVLGMELVGPSKRMFVGIVVEVFWAIGVMILGGVAYYVRDWDYLQMCVSFPILLMFSYWWVIPESPRWLLARGRDEEAEAIIRHAAKVNGATLPEKIFDMKTFDEAYRKEKMWHILSSPRFTLRMAVLCFNWTVASMVFYGLSLNAGNLAGDLYVNYELLGLVELVAYALCILLVNRIGRKKMYIACMIVGGGSCVGTIFPTLYGDESMQIVSTVLSLMGKCGAAAAFAIIFVYSAELFPTLLRNSLMGVTCLCARFGGMISPYVADLNTIVPGDFGRALPSLVFGITTIVGGVLCIILPETLNKHLPETLEEATNFGKPERSRRRRQGQEDSEFRVDDSTTQSPLATGAAAFPEEKC